MRANSPEWSWPLQEPTASSPLPQWESNRQRQHTSIYSINPQCRHWLDCVCMYLLCLASHTTTLNPVWVHHIHASASFFSVSIWFLIKVIRLLPFSTIYSGVLIFISHSIASPHLTRTWLNCCSLSFPSLPHLPMSLSLCPSICHALFFSFSFAQWM